MIEPDVKHTSWAPAFLFWMLSGRIQLVIPLTEMSLASSRLPDEVEALFAEAGIVLPTNNPNMSKYHIFVRRRWLTFFFLSQMVDRLFPAGGASTTGTIAGGGAGGCATSAQHAIAGPGRGGAQDFNAWWGVQPIPKTRDGSFSELTWRFLCCLLIIC